MVARDESGDWLAGSVQSADCIFVYVKTRSAVTAWLVVAVSCFPAPGEILNISTILVVEVTFLFYAFDEL